MIEGWEESAAMALMRIATAPSLTSEGRTSLLNVAKMLENKLNKERHEDVKQKEERTLTADISDFKLTYTQEGNTLGTTSDDEYLTLSFESSDFSEGGFYVLQTDGWSFDSLEELLALLNNFKTVTEALLDTMKK